MIGKVSQNNQEEEKGKDNPLKTKDDKNALGRGGKELDLIRTVDAGIYLQPKEHEGGIEPTQS